MGRGRRAMGTGMHSIKKVEMKKLSSWKNVNENKEEDQSAFESRANLALWGRKPKMIACA